MPSSDAKLCCHRPAVLLYESNSLWPWKGKIMHLRRLMHRWEKLIRFSPQINSRQYKKFDCNHHLNCKCFGPRHDSFQTLHYSSIWHRLGESSRRLERTFFFFFFFFFFSKKAVALSGIAPFTSLFHQKFQCRSKLIGKGIAADSRGRCMGRITYLLKAVATQVV